MRQSGGLNLGLDFLPGALPFSPAVPPPPDPDLAADVVWFDALVTNPDRTVLNPNLLVWHGRPWLIDHGAALYIHHTWRDPEAHARRPFERLRDHVLLPFAGSLAAADERLAPLVTPDLVERIVAAIPDLWLPDDPLIGDAAAQRRAYRAYVARRLESPRPWLAEADHAA
jgi:hypothetical protein